MPAGLGGCRPDRAAAEVVDAGLDRRGGRLLGGVSGTPDEDVVAEHVAHDGHRQIALAEMEHVGTDRIGDVGPVVHGQELAVPVTGLTEDGEEVDLLTRLKALLAQLHDVDPAREGGVEEVREVSPVTSPVGAQIQAGVRNRGLGHVSSLPCGGPPRSRRPASPATCRRG